MLDIDLDAVNPDSIDTFQKTGGLTPEGKYHVRLDGARDANANSGATGTELHFTVIGGEYAGAEIKETLWDSDKEASKNRQLLFASRLGLIKRDGTKFVRVQGKNNFCDCLNAEVVIEIKHEKYQNKKGQDAVASRVTFGGIWEVNDPAVRSVKKAKAGEAPPAKKKVDTSDL